MMQRKPFTLIAAVIFALMAAVHLYRLAVGFDITIGTSAVPLMASWVALVITSGLSAMLFSEARR